MSDSRLPCRFDLFTSAKTACAIRARRPALREALVEATLDPWVRSIAHQAKAIVGTSISQWWLGPGSMVRARHASVTAWESIRTNPLIQLATAEHNQGPDFAVGNQASRTRE